MALKDVVTSETTKSMALGIAAGTVAFFLVPAFSRLGRPLVRAAAKSGLILYEKARETAAEMAEILEDLLAEARAELEKVEIIETEGEAKTGGETAGEAGMETSGETAGEAGMETK